MSHSWAPSFPGCIGLARLACQPGRLSKRGDWRSGRYLSRSGDGASEQLPSGPPGQACSGSQRSSGVRLVGSEGALAPAEAVTHFPPAAPGRGWMSSLAPKEVPLAAMPVPSRWRTWTSGSHECVYGGGGGGRALHPLGWSHPCRPVPVTEAGDPKECLPLCSLELPLEKSAQLGSCQGGCRQRVVTMNQISAGSLQWYCLYQC